MRKYTESTEALVAFKLSIDLAKMNISWDSMHQLIDQNIENFHVKALNGRRPSLENWLKSDSSVISLISLEYVHFVHFFGRRLSFKIWQEIPYFFDIFDFIEIW